MKAKQFEKCVEQAKLTALPGRWGRVDSWGHITGSFVDLKAQNGFFAQHKMSHARVFIVTTGPHKGIWQQITY